MSEKKYDLVVIGAGPGGYVASIVAAQKGMKVANIEKRETLGGTCLNVGCIPSKALLHASEQYENNVKNNANLSWGIKTSDVSIDVQQLMKKKSTIVDELTKGINFLFNKNKIDKEVWTDNDFGDRVELRANESDIAEARNLCQKIVSLNNTNFSNVAILYRTNAQSRPIEDSLRLNKIPYQIFGGVSFYNRKEIKDVLAYLRLIVNSSDEESLKRIINYPARGIGQVTINKIILACLLYTSDAADE